MAFRKDARDAQKGINKGVREISAGVIIYRKTKEGPRFLLLYHGGRSWSFPKGKRGEGEGNFRTALREVYEETGLRQSDLRFGEWFKVQDRFMFTRERERVFKTVTYYLAETTNPRVRLSFVPEHYQGERHEGYAWFLYRDALRVLRHESMRRNLKNAYERITKRKEERKGISTEKTSP